jgi:hypothetical protein
MSLFQSNSMGASFLGELESAVIRLGQGSFKPDIARNDHHRTKQTITANEIDKQSIIFIALILHHIL